LLTVSRGPSALETGSFVLRIGADGLQRADTAGGARGAPTPEVAPKPADTKNAAFSAAGNEAAAQVGDRVITIAEVDREWRRTDPAGYLALGRELYDQRRRIVDTMVADELLAREAAARGLTTEALLEQEIPKRRIALPDSAVTSLYVGLGDNTRGASLEQMRPALRAWLERNTEPELAKMSYIEELVKVSTRAETFLAAPRVQVERSVQDVVLGAVNSAVEIVVFGEFQSAEYARLAQAFNRLRDTFGDRLRIVFKNLPAIGPESVDAAEAAQCANAQGKFWPYHDALLVQAGATMSARLAQSATAAGVDREAFKVCVDSRRFRDVIEQALDEARRYGLERSPSFLVNGRLAPAPPPFLPPFEFFKRLIEEELSLVVGR
ncbi:MAG: hypothetical protein A3H97_17530, partial [Acidobacteria bacterium RIFCSPLOWO2_02_FULL_65_29]